MALPPLGMRFQFTPVPGGRECDFQLSAISFPLEEILPAATRRITSSWIVQQLREVFAYDAVPKFLGSEQAGKSFQDNFASSKVVNIWRKRATSLRSFLPSGINSIP